MPFSVTGLVVWNAFLRGESVTTPNMFVCISGPAVAWDASWFKDRTGLSEQSPKRKVWSFRLHRQEQRPLASFLEDALPWFSERTFGVAGLVREGLSILMPSPGETKVWMLTCPASTRGRPYS